MKDDARTFLLTVLGIPLILSAATGIHALDAQSISVVTRPPLDTSPPVVLEKEPEPAPVVPVAVPVRVAVQPTPAPLPVQTPTPAPVVTTNAPVKTERVKKVSKPSRKTRAS